MVIIFWSKLTMTGIENRVSLPQCSQSGLFNKIKYRMFRMIKENFNVKNE